jgi:hypothetical protein
MSHKLSTTVIVCLFAGSAAAQPTLGSISQTARTDFTVATVNETLTGTGFVDGMAVNISPMGMVTAGKVTISSTTSATVTLTVLPRASGIVTLTVTTPAGTSSPGVQFDTACLEALASGGCAFRFEVIATGTTGASSQTGKNTSPNIQAIMDYQFVSPFDPGAKKAAATAGKIAADERVRQALKGTPEQTKAINAQTVANAAATSAEKLGATQGIRGRMVGHLGLNIGFTQAVIGNKVQSANATTNSTSTTTSNTTPSGTTTSTTTTTSSTGTANPSTSACPATSNNGSAAGSGTAAMCTIAAPQNAFVAKAGTTIGLTLYRDGSGIFSEIGLGAHGIFQYSVAPNQIIQNGALTYIDLGSNNGNQAVGIYEATAHFKVSQWGHDAQARPSGNYGNVSNLLVMEGGYQNNSGLAQLIATSPQTNTRNRFVGRIYVTPEVDKVKHTTVTLGMEYSGGLNGGPHVVQIFFGTNINPAKLFSNGN